MTIDPKRLAHAIENYSMCPPGSWLKSSDFIEYLLKHDDLFRAHPAPVPTSEPELPEGVKFYGEAGLKYFKGEEHIYPAYWSASDLRAIADHMEYKSRAASAAEAVVTDEMVSIFWKEYDRDEKQFGYERTRWALKAALEAQRSEARKETK
jgi:hypothetical protein